MVVGCGCLVFFSPIILVVGGVLWLILMVTFEDVHVEREVPSFYQEAGFKGNVTVPPSIAEGLSTRHPYRYEEKVDGEVIRVEFNNTPGSGWDETDPDNQGKNYDSPEELATNYSDSLIEPLVQAGFNYQLRAKSVKSQLRDFLETRQLKLNDFNVSVISYYDERDQIFIDQLTKDLTGKELEPLRGLATLDFETYAKIGFLTYDIVIEGEWPLEVFELSPLQLPDGDYTFYYSYGDESPLKRIATYQVEGGVVHAIESHYY